mmetsp:Transcript_3450/g.6005  ORF Transcript_3450/g.6005 Transcript_3450/m.6005 type:complete len:208 (-) Transcript_3450:1024-1647(-)
MLFYGLIVQQMKTVVFVKRIDGPHALGGGTGGDYGFGTVDGAELAADARLVRQFHGGDVPAGAEGIGQFRIVVPRGILPGRGEGHQLTAVDQLGTEFLGIEPVDDGGHPLPRIAHLHLVVLPIVAGQRSIVTKSGFAGERILQFDPHAKRRQYEAVANIAQSLRNAGTVIIPIETATALILLFILPSTTSTTQKGSLIFDRLIPLLD